MDKDYSHIKAACEEILGYGQSTPATDPREYRELRKDMYELSAKCQQVSRSPKRR